LKNKKRISDPVWKCVFCFLQTLSTFHSTISIKFILCLYFQQITDEKQRKKGELFDPLPLCTFVPLPLLLSLFILTKGCKQGIVK